MATTDVRVLISPDNAALRYACLLVLRAVGSTTTPRPHLFFSIFYVTTFIYFISPRWQNRDSDSVFHELPRRRFACSPPTPRFAFSPHHSPPTRPPSTCIPSCSVLSRPHVCNNQSTRIPPCSVLSGPHVCNNQNPRIPPCSVLSGTHVRTCQEPRIPLCCLPNT